MDIFAARILIIIHQSAKLRGAARPDLEDPNNKTCSDPCSNFSCRLRFVFGFSETKNSFLDSGTIPSVPSKGSGSKVDVADALRVQASLPHVFLRLAIRLDENFI